ncbi:protein kinase, putative [Plasmodium ovale wallikeri]|uniref:Protein kinase, putative n=1 Tax=Plasmodium ovale wallikeri TaxID=864142 RepID=A0A1A8ZB27_PLAOA|nr:protein kinase, putative [Plasmodium ovale wallikeri]
MSRWCSLKGKIIWPREFAYVVENEGYNNTFGHSYVVKYNGNVVHKNLKKGLNRVEKMLNATKNICEDLEQKQNNYDSDNLEYSKDNTSEEINNANQILLRLNDKKQAIRDSLSKINTIDDKYDIRLKNETSYVFHLDAPFANVEGDCLTYYLKKAYFNEYQANTKKREKQVKNKMEDNDGKGYKTFLYNLKIIEYEETIVENREFIFSEANTEHAKINTLINEGKCIKNALYEYKEYCINMHNFELPHEQQNGEGVCEYRSQGQGAGSGNGRRTATGGRTANGERSSNDETEVTYEGINVLPYCDIIMLKKKELNRVVNIAGFLTPFLLNGNVRKFIENVKVYVKYKFDSHMVYKNLCNIIRLMSYLEDKNIPHGNVKPSNLFISNNGFFILLGNFVPKSKLANYYFYVIQKRRKCPKYISPELLAYLKNKIATVKIKKRKNKHIEKYFHKNDVFCLGLCFYYIITMKEDILNYIDDQHVFLFKVESIQSCITKPALFSLLKNMLTYEHKHRPSWSSLLALIRGKELNSDARDTTTRGIQPHAGYNHTWDTTTRGIQLHVGYNYTWDTTTRGIQPHVGYNYTRDTTTRGIQPHVGYNHTTFSLSNSTESISPMEVFLPFRSMSQCGWLFKAYFFMTCSGFLLKFFVKIISNKMQTFKNKFVIKFKFWHFFPICKCKKLGMCILVKGGGGGVLSTYKCMGVDGADVRVSTHARACAPVAHWMLFYCFN